MLIDAIRFQWELEMCDSDKGNYSTYFHVRKKHNIISNIIK